MAKKETSKNQLAAGPRSESGSAQTVNLVLVRSGLALSIGVLWQFVIGWEWGDFIGRSIIILLISALSYPLERWFKRRGTAI